MPKRGQERSGHGVTIAAMVSNEKPRENYIGDLQWQGKKYKMEMQLK